MTTGHSRQIALASAQLIRVRGTSGKKIAWSLSAQAAFKRHVWSWYFTEKKD